MVGLFGSNGGMVPNCLIVSFSGGRPNCASNVLMSLAMVGEPYESTMSIVRPRPVMPCLYSGFRS